MECPCLTGTEESCFTEQADGSRVRDFFVTNAREDSVKIVRYPIHVGSKSNCFHVWTTSNLKETQVELLLVHTYCLCPPIDMQTSVPACNDLVGCLFQVWPHK